MTVGETTANGRVFLEAQYCFGNCALGPAVRIGDAVYGGVFNERFDELVAPLMAGTAAATHAADANRHEAPGTPRVYASNDTGACSVGADDVARAIAERAREVGLAVEIVRNGSRGAYWMEPLVEVDTPQGRVGFANVTVEQVPALIAGAVLPDATHAMSVGLVREIPWLRDQQRLTFARAGEIDPWSIADYRAHGGLAGLERAVTLSPQAIIDELKLSGLRGRGGAAFPAHIKWQTVHDAVSDTKYVVCNADEGDSGTFADRLLMEADPFQLIEGMAIAVLAVGATRGFVYIRSEYPHAVRTMERAVEIVPRARCAGCARAGIGARV